MRRMIFGYIANTDAGTKPESTAGNITYTEYHKKQKKSSRFEAF